MRAKGAPGKSVTVADFQLGQMARRQRTKVGGRPLGLEVEPHFNAEVAAFLAVKLTLG
jgi:hypothetical protein